MWPFLCKWESMELPCRVLASELFLPTNLTCSPPPAPWGKSHLEEPDSYPLQSQLRSCHYHR